MCDTLSPAMAFGSSDFCNPQATISLADASIQNSLMTPEPTSPESYYNVKEESEEGDESKKPTKKRKSWGQELPTPKTNLPPRYATTTAHSNSHSLTFISSKRAKTEDEKEQRRIERVLRNRQAAQSSRERKRQEVEKLEGEKSYIEHQNESLKSELMAVQHEKFLLAQKLAKMTALMEAIKRGSSVTSRHSSPPLGGFPNSPPLKPDLLPREQFIKQEMLDECHYTAPTPQDSPPLPTSSYSSPSTATYSESSTPAAIALDLDALNPSSDMTQHPAAMLCDLQCQSEEVCRATTRPTAPPARPIPSSSANPLYLTLISAIYSQLMSPLRMIFISLRTGSPLPPSMMKTPMVLPLIQWLISTPANLQPLSLTRATTPKPTATQILPVKAISTREATRSRIPIRRPKLLRRLLLSSPSLARPLRAATGQALRLKTGSTTGENGVQEPGAERVGRKGDDAGRGESVRSMLRDGRRSGQKRMRGDDRPGVNGVQLPPACGKREKVRKPCTIS